MRLVLTVWDDAGEEGEVERGEVVAAPAGLALAREPEGVVAGLGARPHAAAHVAAHAAAAVCHTNTEQHASNAASEGKATDHSKHVHTGAGTR